jgi:TnpA family transposase
VSRGYPTFPTDPADEELAHDWTLSAADLVEVRRCRGDDNRHRFAIQLCALRTLGRFADDIETVPVHVANHIGAQLGLPATLFVRTVDRMETEREQAQRIRAYLRYTTFDEPAQARLDALLAERAAEGLAPAALLGIAVAALRSWRTQLPAVSTIERLVHRFASRAEQEAWQRIRASLPSELCVQIDQLLEVASPDRRSPLHHLKQSPPQARPSAILTYLERAEFLQGLGLGALDFGGVWPEVLAALAELARRYDVKEIRRFVTAKRYAMVSCFRAETHKTVLDHVVEMHRSYLLTLQRHARRRLVTREHQAQHGARAGLSTVLRAMRRMMQDPEQRTLRDIYDELGEDLVRAAVAACAQLEALGDRGLYDEIRAGHHLLKRYLPRFLRLPFRAQPGSEELLGAIELARALHRGDVKRLGADVPLGFASAPWRRAIADPSGEIDVPLWEFALAAAVRDALQSGDLYLEESRHHVSFWNLLHSSDAWFETRERAYAELALPIEVDRALARLRDDLDAAAHALEVGLRDNRFARLVGDRLSVPKEDALETPRSVRNLKRLIETRLPRIRLEDLLVEVDGWCGFTRELTPLHDAAPRTENLYPALLAALVAHGTNLGIATMAQSTKGVSMDTLQHVSRWYLGADALKAASRALVDYHHGLELSATWGEGHVSSSDGQRFGVQESSLLASFYPRYFGYYDRALTVYTHQADQWSVFGQRAISCSEREASFVLDGLLENDTILELREHHTDTHGATEHLFGLCYLLGFAFMPRFKDVADQSLYRFERTAKYGSIDVLFDGTADVALIGEQWDALVRVAASLQSRTSPAHVVLKRLAASSDRLANALRALGRLLKTTHILRYLHDAPLRARIQLQLNRGESRHDLARRLFFANRGIFRSGDYAEIMNKVSALSLLSNVVLVWNTVRIGAILEQLSAAGHEVRREDLARISPMMDAHVIATGSYHFDRAVRARAAAADPRTSQPRQRGGTPTLGAEA